MKCIYFLSLVLAAAVAAVDYYPVNVANFKIEDVAVNKATLLGFLLCFIDEMPCVGFEAELKKYTRDSVVTGCSRCTGPQKHMAHGFLVAFAETLPEEYEKFKAKYDPTGKYIPAMLQNTADN